jgi:Fungal potassium channel
MGVDNIISAEQKWTYINLDDFSHSSCGTPFSYFVLIVGLIISIAVYAVDCYVAVNLLAFNRWSGQIKPTVPFDISKWIFAVCIILSLVFLTFEWIRAIRVIRRGGVAEAYLDPLAVRIRSVGSGGWRRFLLFAELTKSRKGADYVALFTYFSFKCK